LSIIAVATSRNVVMTKSMILMAYSLLSFTGNRTQELRAWEWISSSYRKVSLMLVHIQI
jgi:hypothetical protein